MTDYVSLTSTESYKFISSTWKEDKNGEKGEEEEEKEDEEVGEKEEKKVGSWRRRMIKI